MPDIMQNEGLTTESGKGAGRAEEDEGWSI
jgi:hypothetical protein